MLEEIKKTKREGKTTLELLEHLAGLRSGKSQLVEQAVTSLARLQTGLREVVRQTRNKSLGVKYAAILGLAEYAATEEMAEDAWKKLEDAFKGPKQQTNFVILAAGDLASRLQDIPNSETREDILDWLRDDKKRLGSNDNYTRACSVLALGVANDATAVPQIAAYLDDTTIDHYVAGACSVALGLLKQADKAQLVIDKVVQGRYNADAKGYGLIGLALMGDTTRMDVVLSTARKEQQKETARQAPLAIGVLGDRGQTKTLTDYFSKEWKQKDRVPVSNAAFGLAWIRDAESVDRLLKVASTSGDAAVRAMGVIALGYVGAGERGNGLTRCFAMANYRDKFSGFRTLYHISNVL